MDRDAHTLSTTRALRSFSFAKGRALCSLDLSLRHCQSEKMPLFLFSLSHVCTALHSISIVYRQQSHFVDCRITSHWRIDVNLLSQSQTICRIEVSIYTHTHFLLLCRITFCHSQLITPLNSDYFSSGGHFLIEHKMSSLASVLV